MTALRTEVFELNGCTATLLLGDCLELLPVKADCFISDPPYGDRTHKGHDASANGHAGFGHDRSKRNGIDYVAWTATEVRSVCQTLPDSGWTCFLSDHTLAREWERELAAVGRYVFAPLPCIVPGRSVRLTGDGPSSWTDWLIVARTKKEIKWGTLPGYYEGKAGEIQHMGGKPLGMMCRIVSDYSRSGDTVADICMGAATTGVACLRTGRNFIGIEKDPQHFETACARLKRECEQQLLFKP